MKRLRTFIAGLLLTSALTPISYAQQPAQVIGPITPGDCAIFNSPTVIKDGGFACPAGGPALPLPTLQPGQVLGNNGTVAAPAAAIPARTQLTGAASYYVNGNSGGTAVCGPTGASTCSAGSDSNNCLTPGAACLTVQHVVNILIRSTDLAGFTANIFLAHGSSNNYAFTCESGPVIGQSVFGIQGDTTAPTAVTMVATSGVAVVKDGCTVSIDSVAFADNGTNNASVFVAVGTGNAGHADLSNITYGALGIGVALSADYAGTIALNGGTHTITGSEAIFIVAKNGGVVDTSGVTVTLSGTPNFSATFADLVNSGTIAVSGTSNFSGAATGQKCIINGPLNLNGFDPNAVFPGSTNCTANNLVQSVNVTSGALANGTNAFALTATQPTSPVAPAVGINWSVTSAGSASQNNVGMLMLYNAGYTGSSNTSGFSVANSAAGTGGALPASGSNTALGNIAGVYNTVPTTTGFNYGLAGEASNGNANFGAIGLAQVAKNSAKNIGMAGYAINTGSSPVEIGVIGSLNPNVIPAVSAAGIFDNGSQTAPIALFQVGGATQFQVDANGQIITGFGTPTIASGACGATTNGTLASGSTNQAGQVQIAGASTTTCTISFSKTLTAAPLACVLFPANATAAATGTTLARVSSISVTAWVITGSALANANYYYHCI